MAKLKDLEELLVAKDSDVLLIEDDECTKKITKENLFKGMSGVDISGLATKEELAAEVERLNAVIEELKALIDAKHPVPEKPADFEHLVYYGYIPATVTDYSEITLEMIKGEGAVMQETHQPLSGKINVGGGIVPGEQFIVVAVPASLGKTIKKDDGFGGKVEFEEDVCGANGVAVDFDGVEYRLFGEITLDVFECFIYMV